MAIYTLYWLGTNADLHRSECVDVGRPTARETLDVDALPAAAFAAVAAIGPGATVRIMPCCAPLELSCGACYSAAYLAESDARSACYSCGHDLGPSPDPRHKGDGLCAPCADAIIAGRVCVQCESRAVVAGSELCRHCHTVARMSDGSGWRVVRK